MRNVVISFLMLMVLGCASTTLRTPKDIKPKLGPNNLFILNNTPRVCSALDAELCQLPVNQSATYQVDALSIKKISQMPWIKSRMNYRDALIALLNSQLSKTFKSWAEIEKLLATHSDGPITLSKQLNGKEKSWLRYALLSSFTGDVSERISVVRNMNTSRIQLFKEFIRYTQSASRVPLAKPTIGIITSGSAEPLLEADYYSTIFRQLGAKVIWIPLNAILIEARKLKDVKGDCRCQDVATQIYPLLLLNNKKSADYIEKLNFYCENFSMVEAILRSINGLFFVGAEESLLERSFYDEKDKLSSAFKIIVERFNNGHLMVGGELNAISLLAAKGESLKLFTSGFEKEKLNALSETLATTKQGQTWNQAACKSGVRCQKRSKDRNLNILMETNFTKETRYPRMLKGLYDINGRLGIGLEQDTALVLSSLNHELVSFSVFGEQGAFLFNVVEADFNLDQNEFTAEDVRLGYIQESDALFYDIKKQRFLLTPRSSAAEFSIRSMSKAFTTYALLDENVFKQVLMEFAVSDEREQELHDGNIWMDIEKSSDYTMELKSRMQSSFVGLQTHFEFPIQENEQ